MPYVIGWKKDPVHQQTLPLPSRNPELIGLFKDPIKFQNALTKLHNYF